MKLHIAPLAAAGLLALASLNAWSLSSLVGEMLDGNGQGAEKLEWRPQLSASADAGNLQHPNKDYPLILAHPIFYKSREPFVPPPPAPAPPPKAAQPAPSPPVDPGLVLGGVMTVGHLRKAYLLTKSNSEGSWVSEGDNFMGWVVASVDGSSAKVRQQDRTIELQLYPQGQVDNSTATVEGAKGAIASPALRAVKAAPPIPWPQR
jgi:hypothetical protein